MTTRVAQTPLLDLTVAQNIFIGREPRAGGFLTRDRALAASAGELLGRLITCPSPSGRRLTWR